MKGTKEEMSNSNSDFDDDELATLRKLEAEQDAADDADPDDADTPEPKQQAAADVASEQQAEDDADDTEESAPAAEAKQQPAEAPKGDIRAALRASRRAERRAASELERLKTEVEALRGKVAQTTESATEDDIDPDLENDFPAVAKPLKALKARLEEATRELAELKKQPAAKDSEPEFVPAVLPEAVQDAVDDVPELAEWQATREHQDKWALAVQADNLLRASPKWAAKPIAERLAEAVRRVKAELDDDAPATAVPSKKDKPRIDPKEAVAKAGRKEQPITLSDLRGGDAVQQVQTLSRRDMESLSDDEIMNRLV